MTSLDNVHHAEAISYSQEADRSENGAHQQNVWGRIKHVAGLAADAIRALHQPSLSPEDMRMLLERHRVLCEQRGRPPVPTMGHRIDDLGHLMTLLEIQHPEIAHLPSVRQAVLTEAGYMPYLA